MLLLFQGEKNSWCLLDLDRSTGAHSPGWSDTKAKFSKKVVLLLICRLSQQTVEVKIPILGMTYSMFLTNIETTFFIKKKQNKKNIITELASIVLM